MKSTILMIILIGLIIVSCSEEPGIDSAESYQDETECPRGMVNDTYPGSCGLYVDKDGNNICDNSE